MVLQFYDEQAKSQLKLLSEISELLLLHNCEFWLRGGWAIDFLLGRITRPHADIDLITWILHRELLESVLKESGYQRIPVKEQYVERQSDFRKDNVDVTFGYLNRSAEGILMMNGLPEWKWRADSLMPHFFMLNGISARVLNPRQLLQEKEVYEQIGRVPRPKDIESKKTLLDIIQGRPWCGKD